MKTNYTLIASFCILIIIVFSSCSGSEDEFLKRNLNDLSFDYIESSNTFTIRATGEWSIDVPSEYSWVHITPTSGHGNGVDYETVTVKCDRNKANDRNAVIYLNGSGQSDITINIFQLNGLFEWKTFANGKKFDIDKYPKVGEESTTSIRIPYLKAMGDEKYPVEVTISGKGADGLSVSQTEVTIVEEGDGAILIPIKGTPTTQGLIEVKLSINEIEFGTDVTIAAIGEKIISQKFDKLLWGGDCIGNKSGVVSTASNAELALDNATRACAVGDNGTAGLTSTIRGANPAFMASIEMEGWLGYRNYMRPGYIQLGATATTDKEFGSLITPGLNIPSGKRYDILVQFKGAKYNSPSVDKIMFALYPKGQTGFNIADLPKMSEKIYVPFEIGYQNWGDFSGVVQNATDESALLISFPDYWVETSVKAGRAYIDDIVVIY